MTVLWSFGIWSKLKRWKRKNSVTGWLMNLNTNPKPGVLKCCRFEVLFYATTNHFSICGMGWEVDFIWKALPRAKPAPVKGHGHCLVVCDWSDPLQLSESRQKHYPWEVCSANRWDTPKTETPTAGTDQQKGPSPSPGQCLTLCHTVDASKVKRIWLQSSASSTKSTCCCSVTLSYLTLRTHGLQHARLPCTSPSPKVCRSSPDLSPTDYHFFKHLDNLLQGKRFHNSRRQKVLSQSLSNPEAGMFMLQE